MPSPMTYWLQQIVFAFVLLASILLLTLAPARLVLLPLWPWPVEEVLVAGGDAPGGERAFVARNSSGPPGRLVVSDWPLSLAAMEIPGHAPFHGFIAGIRTEPDGPLHSVADDVLVVTIGAGDIDRLVEPITDWIKNYGS
jgi:hypothetical protein